MKFNDADAVCVGASAADAVYLGNALVWPAVQPDDCLGEWSTVIVQPPYSPLSLSGENNHIVETATDPAAGIYVASSNPLSPITIDWPVSEVRCFGARIQDFMPVSGINEKWSITVGLLNMDTGLDLAYVISKQDIDAGTQLILFAHGPYIENTVDNPDDFMILGVRGNGQLIAWSGDWVDQLDIDYALDTGKTWIPIALVDNSVGALSGHGKIALRTSAANLRAPSISIPGITKISDFCGNEIS